MKRGVVTITQIHWRKQEKNKKRKERFHIFLYAYRYYYSQVLFTKKNFSLQITHPDLKFSRLQKTKYHQIILSCFCSSVEIHYYIK